MTTHRPRYAHSAETSDARTVIRLLGLATVRLSLIKRVDEYEHEIADGRDFWGVMSERYGLSLQVAGGTLGNISSVDPFILTASHLRHTLR